MLPLREWDYLQLFRFYLAMAAIWLPVVVVAGLLGMVLSHGAAHQEPLVLPWNTRLLVTALRALAIGLPKRRPGRNAKGVPERAALAKARRRPRSVNFRTECGLTSACS